MLTNQKSEFRIFLRYFFHYIWVLKGVIFSLLLLLIIAGVIISRFEMISLGEAIYFTFITAFTIGFGDITPLTIFGKVFSILIGIIGIIFAGLVVAIAVKALSSTVEEQKKIL